MLCSWLRASHVGRWKARREVDKVGAPVRRLTSCGRAWLGVLPASRQPASYNAMPTGGSWVGERHRTGTSEDFEEFHWTAADKSSLVVTLAPMYNWGTCWVQDCAKIALCHCSWVFTRSACVNNYWRLMQYYRLRRGVTGPHSSAMLHEVFWKLVTVVLEIACHLCLQGSSSPLSLKMGVERLSRNVDIYLPNFAA